MKIGIVLFVSSLLCVVTGMLIQEYNDNQLKVPISKGYNNIPDARNNNISYNNIFLSTDFKSPTNITKQLPILHIENLSLNKNTSLELLKYYKFFHISKEEWIDTTNVTYISNQNLSIKIEYFGYLEFRQYNLTYIPVTETEIYSNCSLYSINEALNKTTLFLVEHNLFNSSWHLHAKYTRVRDMCYENKTLIINYYYEFIPVYNGLKLIDSKAPCIRISMNPKGEIINLRAYIQNINISTEGKMPKFINPQCALIEFDTNITKYLLIDNTRNDKIEISDMQLVYRRDTKNTIKFIPVWMISIGKEIPTYIYIS